MRDCSDGEVAESNGCGANGKDGTERIRGSRGEEILERVLRGALRIVGAEETGDGIGNFFGSAAIAHGTGDGSPFANAAAHAEIVGVHELAIELDLFALDTDVGDPVLAATVGAAGDVQLDVFAKAGETLFELFAEPAGEGLGFGEGKLA